MDGSQDFLQAIGQFEYKLGRKTEHQTCTSAKHFPPATYIETFVIERIEKFGYAPKLVQDEITSVADKMKGQLKQNFFVDQ